MPERSADKLHAHTLEFRARYRADMNPRYSGWLHGAFVFGVGGVLMLYCLAQIAQLQWTHLPLALLALFIANVGEYMAHRQLGHVKRPIGKLFYKRHTGDHHNFFTHDDYLIDNSRDLRVVLFPAFLLVAVAFGIALPFGLGAAWLFGDDAGWLFAGALLFNYLFYEFIHLCDHLPADKAITRWPLVRQLREHHRLHHDPQHAREVNFNVTLPITDWLLGTLYRAPR